VSEDLSLSFAMVAFEEKSESLHVREAGCTEQQLATSKIPILSHPSKSSNLMARLKYLRVSAPRLFLC